MTQNPFSDLNISDELKRAVQDMGFGNATDIQAQTIPLILEGHDVIGRSQTGTGKTAAFAIPSIELTNGENKKAVQVLVICPTRELAMQSWGEFKKLYKYKSGVKAAVIYGGQHIDRQINELRKGVNIVIGTPGRIMDHMNRNTLKLNNIKLVILDEADEMLNMGFREDIETILKATPAERQTVMFCATMPKEIMAITKLYQKQPKLVEIDRDVVTLQAIEQYYCEVPAVKKPEALIEILKLHKPQMSIIFCNTQKMVDDLCLYLNVKGYDAVGIHGSMRQKVRTQVMENFKSGRSSMLVATDVAARGIDAHNVEAVINFDIPPNTEYYVHRIGRTGRAGKTGKAFTIASGRMQLVQLRNIQRETKSQLITLDMQIEGSVMGAGGEPGFNEIVNTERVENNFQKAAPAPQNSFVRPRREYPAPSGDVAKISLNLGKEQYVTANHIVKAIAEKTSLVGKDIGRIELLSNSTIVEIPETHKQEVIDALKGSKIKGLFVDAKLYSGQPAQKAVFKSDKRDNRGFANRRGKFD
jgi:ATP-dependent RNA helicase DeaD